MRVNHSQCTGNIGGNPLGTHGLTKTGLGADLAFVVDPRLMSGRNKEKEGWHRRGTQTKHGERAETHNGATDRTDVRLKRTHR